jgi:enamine deaminase RidA (YjgF/YER057c/UK114 family)
MSKDHIRDPGKAMYDRFHFSQAVRAGRTLYCSGQLGLAEDGSVPPEFLDEARNAWVAVGRVLDKAGFGWGDIVEYTSYHVGLQSSVPDFMRARDEVLAEPWPAWTAIGISELFVPGARVEIRVTARKRG